MTLYKDVGLWHWVGIDYYAIFKPEALFFCAYLRSTVLEKC